LAGGRQEAKEGDELGILDDNDEDEQDDNAIDRM
jgi:hypothetical protein